MRKFLLWAAASITVLSTATFAQTEEITEIGSIGGSGGSAFIDSVPAGATVTALRLCGAAKVDSIQFFYTTGPGVKHGGNGGTCTTTYLNSGEFIGGVAGYLSSGVITRLSFDTNQGRQLSVGNLSSSNSYNFYYGSKSFSLYPWTHQIVGLKGRSAERIDALGVLIRGHGNGLYPLSGPASGETNVTLTPFSLDARYISYMEACGGAKLDSITINSTKVGGSGGTCSRIYLANGEKIIEVSGYANSVVEYVEIRTNYGKVLVAGRAQTKNFSHKGNYAVNIFGASARLINAIGVDFY